MKLILLCLSVIVITACQPLNNRTPSQLAHGNDSKTDQEQIAQTLARAEISLNHQPEKVINSLQTLSSTEELKPDMHANVQRLLTFAYFANNDYLNGLNNSEQACFLLSGDAQIDYLAEIWQSLNLLSDKTLSRLFLASDNNYQRGWLSFTLITKTQNSHSLIQGISQWQNTYPNHPAQKLIATPHWAGKPQKIALWLPLSGKLKNQGEAIRNGFLSAFYQTKAVYHPEIIVSDTNNQGISELYRQAVQQQADLIIGPLLKSNITQLFNNEKPSIPVLALNNIPESQNNLYQFGLSPDTEAREVAKHVISQGLRQILIITPQNSWGERIAGQFEQDYLSSGGMITDRLNYRKDHLSYQLSRLLHISQSKNRVNEVEKTLGSKLRYTLRRREDFDAIFLVADPDTARQIVPLLRFYYAGDIPTYAISEIYSGQPKPTLDKDLNGIHFVDSPWLIDAKLLTTNLNAIRKNSKTIWPNSSQHYPRFYALGVDAWQLIDHMDRLQLLPKLGIEGATGRLILDKEQHIDRKPGWATMVNGRPKPAA